MASWFMCHTWYFRHHPTELWGVQVERHPGWPLRVILKGNLTTVFWIFYGYYEFYGYIEPSTDLTRGHAHEQRGKGLGCPQQAHAVHHYQVLQIKYHILHDMIDSKHFYSTHLSSATTCTSWLTSWMTSTAHTKRQFNNCVLNILTSSTKMWVYWTFHRPLTWSCPWTVRQGTWVTPTSTCAPPTSGCSYQILYFIWYDLLKTLL